MKIKTEKYKNLFQIYRFIIIGICSVLIDFIFYYLFIYINLFDPENSKRISFIIGAIFAFYANRSYVFKIIDKKISQYFAFALLYFVSFSLNSFVHDFVLLKLEILLVSFMIATMVSTIINFCGQKFIIFKNTDN